MLAFFLLPACLVLMAGCGSNVTGKDQLPDSAAIPDGGLPGLDSLARPDPRTVLIHSGLSTDCLALSDACIVGNGKVLIPSLAGEMEWAIWGWYGFSENDYPTSLTVATAGASDEYWVFVSDFSRQRWQAFGPLTANFGHVDLSTVSGRLCGKDGVFYAAVATWGGHNQEIRAINVASSVAAEISPLRQCWLRASQDSSPDSISIKWEKPLADTQRLSRWIAGENESLAQILPALAGTTSFVDNSAAPGQYVCYRILSSELGRLRPSSPVALGRAGSPSDGRRLSGRLIYDEWHSAAGRELWLSNAELTSSSDGDGYFSFPALPPGSYGLHIIYGGQKTLLGSYDVNIADIDTGVHKAQLHGTPRGDWYWLYPPQNLQAEHVGASSMRLSWNTVKFASHYEIFRSASQSGDNAVLVGSTTAAEHVLAGEPSGLNYYSVVSVDEPFNRRSAHCGSLGYVSAGGFSPDSIFAVASRTKVTAGEKVRITVFCSQTASPLLYLDGVRVKFEAGNHYAAGSFNIGQPGGARYEADGVWRDIAGDLGFLEVPDLWWKEKPAVGQSCIDFNITPINGREKDSISGALFSFELEVWEDTSLSLERMDNWNRTYYSGADNKPTYWGNDSNEGMPGIEVTNN